jgi:hypothetical protein
MMSRKKNTTFRKQLEAELAPHLAQVSASTRKLIRNMIDLLSRAYDRGGIPAARRALDQVKEAIQ